MKVGIVAQVDRGAARLPPHNAGASLKVRLAGGAGRFAAVFPRTMRGPH